MLIPYEQDPPSAGTPAWRDVHRFWMALMEAYSATARAPASTTSIRPICAIRRSYVANFMHGLVVARTATERERIIGEAAAFLEEQRARRGSSRRRCGLSVRAAGRAY